MRINVLVLISSLLACAPSCISVEAGPARGEEMVLSARRHCELLKTVLPGERPHTFVASLLPQRELITSGP